MIYDAIKGVLFTPSKFIQEVHHEKGYRKQIYFITAFAFFAFLFLTYRYIESINTYVRFLGDHLGITVISEIPLTIKTYAAFYLAFTATFILLSLLRYWVTHWFVVLFKGKHGYYQTYKALVYTLSPEYISIPLFVALVVLIPSAFADKMLWIYIGLLGLPFLALSLYQVYLRTIALSRLQEITNAESFLAIYVLGFITQLFVIGILEALLLAAAYLVYSIL